MLAIWTLNTVFHCYLSTCLFTSVGMALHYRRERKHWSIVPQQAQLKDQKSFTGIFDHRNPFLLKTLRRKRGTVERGTLPNSLTPLVAAVLPWEPRPDRPSRRCLAAGALCVAGPAGALAPRCASPLTRDEAVWGPTLPVALGGARPQPRPLSHKAVARPATGPAAMTKTNRNNNNKKAKGMRCNTPSSPRPTHGEKAARGTVPPEGAERPERRRSPSFPQGWRKPLRPGPPRPRPEARPRRPQPGPGALRSLSRPCGGGAGAGPEPGLRARRRRRRLRCPASIRRQRGGAGRRRGGLRAGRRPPPPVWKGGRRGRPRSASAGWNSRLGPAAAL